MTDGARVMIKPMRRHSLGEEETPFFFFPPEMEVRERALRTRVKLN